MALALAEHFGVDEAKVTKMAVLHDLAESKIGDVVAMRGSKTLANQADKITKERVAMREIAALAGHESDWADVFDELIADQTFTISNCSHSWKSSSARHKASPPHWLPDLSSTHRAASAAPPAGQPAV